MEGKSVDVWKIKRSLRKKIRIKWSKDRKDEDFYTDGWTWSNLGNPNINITHWSCSNILLASFRNRSSSFATKLLVDKI